MKFVLKNSIIAAIVIFNYLQIIQSDEELLELSCLNETNCKQFQHSTIKTSCVDGQCQCASKNGKIVKCQPLNSKASNIIGGPCPCTQPNAECDKQEQVCYCASNYIPSSDKRRCIAKMVALDGACEQDSQCQKVDFNAVCHESKECKCTKHFVNNEGKCLSIVGHKSSELNDSSCHKRFGANSKYSIQNQHCICMPDHFASADNSYCLNSSKYLENCVENLQCSSTMGIGGKCVENICNCSENYFAIENKSANGSNQTVCSVTIKRGDYCRSNEDCYQHQLQTTEQSMVCIYGECNCKKDFSAYNQEHCIRGNAVGINCFIGLKIILIILVIANKYLYFL